MTRMCLPGAPWPARLRASAERRNDALPRPTHAAPTSHTPRRASTPPTRPVPTGRARLTPQPSLCVADARHRLRRAPDRATQKSPSRAPDAAAATPRRAAALRALAEWIDPHRRRSARSGGRRAPRRGRSRSAARRCARRRRYGCCGRTRTLAPPRVRPADDLSRAWRAREPPRPTWRRGAGRAPHAPAPHRRRRAAEAPGRAAAAHRAAPAETLREVRFRAVAARAAYSPGAAVFARGGVIRGVGEVAFRGRKI